MSSNFEKFSNYRRDFGYDAVQNCDLIPSEGERHFSAKSRLHAEHCVDNPFVTVPLKPTLLQIYREDQTSKKPSKFCRKTDECGLPYLAPSTGTLVRKVEQVLTQDSSLLDIDSNLRASVYAESSIFAAIRPVLGQDFPAVDRARFVQALYFHYTLRKGEAVVKHTTAWWAARLLTQELPESDLQPIMYGGITGRRIKRWANVKTFVRQAELGQAFLMAKKATDVVSEEFVEGELKSHKARLTATPGFQPEWYAGQIRRTVKEVLRSGSWYPSSELAVPSERAHYGWSVKQGGAMGALLWSRTTDSQKLSWSTFEDGLPELVGYVDNGFGSAEIRGFGSEIQDLIVESLTRTAEGEKIEPTAILEEPNCAPSPVLEACKVRVITKGPPLLQYLGKYIQKDLWRELQKHPSFRLIGQPCTVDDIDRFWRVVPRDSFVLSGDYKAATDYLNSWASTLCWEAICEHWHIPDLWQEVGHKILTDHELDYSCVGDPEKVRQQNGQLMGSVISFPILCLVNACVNRFTMEVAYGRRFTLRETGMLINGDDCLLHLPRKAYELWQKFTASVGLKMSVGKNYFSQRFCVINSRMYIAERPERTWLYGNFCRQVEFVNPGHLHGVGRVQSSDDETQTGFLSRCDALIAEAPVAYRDVLIHLFCYLNGDKLKEIASPGQSWFVPRIFGGLGLPRPSTFSWNDVSPIAKKVVRFICNHDDQLFAFGQALEDPIRPCYVDKGLQHMRRVHEKLGLKPRLTRLDTSALDCMLRAERAQSFQQFCLVPGSSDSGSLRHTFVKLAGLAEKSNTPPAYGLPFWDRVIVRSSVEIPSEKVHWDAVYAEMGHWDLLGTGR